MTVSITIIITGGIAAYKALEFIRLANREGFNITPVLTKSAQAFVTPLSVAGVAGQKVHTELLSMTSEMEMGHIALSRKSDLILVYPATANFMAKAAHGIADDLATTLLLATDKPVLITPAMNVRMWEHAATRQNIQTLRSRNVTVFEPDSGSMACGEYGAGRLIEPPVMLNHIKQFLGQSDALQGKKVLLTVGATVESIDPIRYISNHSSGKQGMALAKAFQDAGADVTIIAGKCSVKAPENINVISVQSAQQMHEAALANLPADIAVCTAAVSDWTPEHPRTQKQKKKADQETLQITLKQTTDILAALAKHPQRPALLIGFAAETENGLDHAQQKLKRKGCDWLILNEVNQNNPVFGSNYNQVIIVTTTGHQTLETMSKVQLAGFIVEKIIKSLNGHQTLPTNH